MKKVRLKVTHEPVYMDIEVDDETDTLDEIVGLHRAEIRNELPRRFWLINGKIEIVGSGE